MRRFSIAVRLTLLVAMLSAVLGVPLALFGGRAVEGVLVSRAFADYAANIRYRSDEVLTGSGTGGDETTRSELEHQLVASVAILDAAADSPLVRALNEQIDRTGDEPILVLASDGRSLEVSSREARTVAADPDRSAIVDWDLREIAYRTTAGGSIEDVTFEYRTSTTESGQRFLMAMVTTDLTASATAASDVTVRLLPVFVGVIALATWWVARRALRPVGEMTRLVGAISHRGPLAGERLPVPGARDELAALAVQMNDLLDRIGAGALAQRAFTADAGHELRSPLAVLRSEHEQAIARSPEVPNVLAERSLPEVDRLERIVEDLLDLARVDEGRMPAVVTEVDVDDVVFCEADRRRRVPIDVRQVGAAKAMADVDSVRRVVQHLLDNAARHASTTVAVALHQDGPGGRAVLTVDDDGVGIPRDQRRRVFERFVRLDDARSRGSGGAGLGLSVVAELVGQLGGTVTIGDSPLGGARFEVSLVGADVG